MPKPLPTISITRIVRGATPRELADFLRDYLDVPRREVVARGDRIEMPFSSGRIESGRVVVARCARGAEFTMTTPVPTSVFEAVSNSRYIGRLSTAARRAAVKGLNSRSLGG